MFHDRIRSPLRRRAKALAAAGLAIAAAGLLPAAAGAETAVLQGLDKITARISTFEAPVGQPVHFGSLEITARRCQKTPPEEPPEAAAFLEIVDARPDEPEALLFSGWMFASSPAVSALEHPVYDVWVIDCAADPLPGGSAPGGSAPGDSAPGGSAPGESAPGESGTENQGAAEPD